MQALIRSTVGEIGGHGGKREQVNNVNLKTPGGNSPTYALRRLKRDRPDLAERVVAGELSANAAAIEAGFRRKTIIIPADIDAAAGVLLQRVWLRGAIGGAR